MNPSAALQSTAEDFLDSLSQSPGAAQAELINFILRACGCNDSVDADEVLDYDGVVDSLDNFTEGLKQVRNYFLLNHQSSLTPPRKILLYTP
jgi:cohesin complex subunit SA-1/2